jgi:hypothetical protein
MTKSVNNQLSNHCPGLCAIAVRAFLTFAVLLVLFPVPRARGQWIAPPDPKAMYAAAGRIHNVDADLLEAIAEVESAGNPLSISPKGALGLMQLMPATASRFDVVDPFDPVSSVLGAASFIDYLRNRFAGSGGLEQLPNLLAAYNAGPGAVEKYGGVPPYPETRAYVKRVMEKYTDVRGQRALPGRRLLAWASPLQANTSSADSDGFVLNQLAAIRRGRGRLAAAIMRAPRLTRPVQGAPHQRDDLPGPRAPD